MQGILMRRGSGAHTQGEGSSEKLYRTFFRVMSCPRLRKLGCVLRLRALPWYEPPSTLACSECAPTARDNLLFTGRR